MKEMTAQNKSTARIKLQLEIENRELKERVVELSAKVKSYEVKRIESRSLDESQVELLVWDKNELQSENNKLKNILSWKEEKFESEKKSLEDQVKNLGGLLEQANIKLQSTNTQMRETNQTNSKLSAELRTKVK